MSGVAIERTKFKGEKPNGRGVVEFSEPWAAEVTVKGVETLLCHRSCPNTSRRSC